MVGSNPTKVNIGRFANPNRGLGGPREYLRRHGQAVYRTPRRVTAAQTAGGCTAPSKFDNHSTGDILLASNQLTVRRSGHLAQLVLTVRVMLVFPCFGRSESDAKLNSDSK